jgi:anti-anti-sigma regulatory factor
MDYDFKLINSIPVIRFDYEDGKLIGGDVHLFGEEVLNRISAGTDRIAFDLRNISYFNSYSVGELVGLRNYFLDKGFDCILILEDINITKLFDMLGILDLFKTVSSENDF